MKAHFFIFIFLLPLSSFAQQADLLKFVETANRFGVEIVMPTENAYKFSIPDSNEIIDCQAQFYSKKEKLEIRAFIEDPNEPLELHDQPHLEGMRLATSAATNDEDASTVTFHFMDDLILDRLNAQWGMIFYFQPKSIFSDKSHCKLIGISREGKPNIFVFFLFNKVPDNINDHTGILRFLE